MKACRGVGHGLAGKTGLAQPCWQGNQTHCGSQSAVREPMHATGSEPAVERKYPRVCAGIATCQRAGRSDPVRWAGLGALAEIACGVEPARLPQDRHGAGQLVVPVTVQYRPAGQQELAAAGRVPPSVIPDFLLAEYANFLIGHAKLAFGRGGRTHVTGCVMR
jgi:hypothetical protein